MSCKKSSQVRLVICLTTCNFMRRFNAILIFFLILFLGSGFSETIACNSSSLFRSSSDQDTIHDNQILYNGRVWRDLYNRVTGDQYLFSTDFLPGSITINGKEFKDRVIRYDIFNDEIMTITDNGIVIQLNKEMVDRFTITYRNVVHQFVNLQSDSVNKISGYVDVVYNGDTPLYFKYRKEINIPDNQQRYEAFYLTREVYILREGILHQIKKKKDLMVFLKDKKALVKDFVKSYSLNGLKKYPEIIITVLKYYDSLSR
jgi:hypothetical protein